MIKYIQIIDGPNLNLTGRRQPKLYGEVPVSDVVDRIKSLNKKVEVRYFQNNTEGKLIDKLHSCGYDENCIGVILNGGAYTHSSLAMSDAVAAIPATVIEVHITNIYQRGHMRAKSMLSHVCKGVVAGFGIESYLLAAHALLLDNNM